MGKNFNPLDDEATARTYVTYIRAHQLKVGDVLTETPGKQQHPRNVIVQSVHHGEVLYRGESVPVFFVHGQDAAARNGEGEVRLTRTGWEILEVTRIGDAPVFARFERPDQSFVY